MSIQVKGIAFVYHQVTDIAQAREFYERLLGLKAGIEYEGAPGKWWIEYDVAGATFALKNFGPSSSVPKATLAFEVADIDAAFTALRAANITVVEELTDFPRCRSFAIKDPDGNEIVLHQLKSNIPKFDASLARKIEPYLHEPTGRTVGYHQATGDGRLDLFAPNGLFVATETAPKDSM